MEDYLRLWNYSLKESSGTAVEEGDHQPSPPPPSLISSSNNYTHNAAAETDAPGEEGGQKKVVFYISDSDKEGEEEEEKEEEKEEYQEEEEVEVEEDKVNIRPQSSNTSLNSCLEQIRGYFDWWTQTITTTIPHQKKEDVFVLWALQVAINCSLGVIEESRGQTLSEDYDLPLLEKELFQLITAALPPSLLEDYIKLTCFMETGPTSSPLHGLKEEEDGGSQLTFPVDDNFSELYNQQHLKSLVLFLCHYLQGLSLYEEEMDFVGVLREQFPSKIVVAKNKVQTFSSSSSFVYVESLVMQNGDNDEKTENGGDNLKNLDNLEDAKAFSESFLLLANISQHKTRVNGQPVRLVLDTASTKTLIDAHHFHGCADFLHVFESATDHPIRVSRLKKAYFQALLMNGSGNGTDGDYFHLFEPITIFVHIALTDFSVLGYDFLKHCSWRSDGRSIQETVYHHDCKAGGKETIIYRRDDLLEKKKDEINGGGKGEKGHLCNTVVDLVKKIKKFWK